MRRRSFKNSYLEIKSLGFGGSGEVVCVENMLNKSLYAIKLVQAEGNPYYVFREIEVLLNKNLVSPFLLKYEEFFMEGKQACIVMEYCANGDLEQYIKSKPEFLGENEVISIFIQVVEGMALLHRNQILHRDIKPSNILLDGSMRVKLADFGIAKRYSHTASSVSSSGSEMCGTVGYISPESLNGQASPASDVFSLGCSMYMVMSKRVPFDSMAIQKVLAGEYLPITDGWYSEPLKELVYSMMSRDPAMRPTAEHIKIALRMRGVFFPYPCPPPPPVFSDIPIKLRPNPKGGCAVMSTQQGLLCTITTAFDQVYRTVFLDYSLSEGIFRWTVHIAYAEGKTLSEFCFGCAPTDRIALYDEAILGAGNNGSCSLGFWKRGESDTGATLHGVLNKTDLDPKEIQVLNNSLLTVEVDFGSRTLSFFLNNWKVPRVISNIFFPLYLGMSGNSIHFTSKSFQRLFSATTSPIVCKFYQCRPKD